jgi:uncharacterized membrane protein YheB (UPF0754 family)
LSAIIAIIILALALRGIQDYRQLKSQLVAEVQRDVTAQVVDKLIKDTLASVAGRINTDAAELQKHILEQAEKRLRDETLKLADEMAQRDDFRDEVSQRVAALINPGSTTTTPDEFDEPSPAT